MLSRKGFTLIELMIVILIVAVLAAVLVPLLTSRINAAKWSEGKAGAGTVATAIRAYLTERNTDIAAAQALALDTDLGFVAADLQGKYFAMANYAVTNVTYDSATHAMTYTVTVTAPAGVSGGPLTLDHTGAMSNP
ncbi:MAG: prepilin-type N-terminal cleavage/methylation domain-containing protein [Planctomycetota bacterium]|nr:MAG: prepilin-type N-terminal cleavage/methylation domain-containing protein [Planctomycetota bacterium]